MVGREGLISLEETKSTSTMLEVTEGMGLNTGFISSYFITDTRRMELILENAYILLTDKQIITSKMDLIPALELVANVKHQSLVIVADNIKKEALYALEKLGFSIKKMQPVVEKIIYENSNFSVEEVIKVALKTV